MGWLRINKTKWGWYEVVNKEGGHCADFETKAEATAFIGLCKKSNKAGKYLEWELRKLLKKARRIFPELGEQRLLDELMIAQGGVLLKYEKRNKEAKSG